MLSQNVMECPGLGVVPRKVGNARCGDVAADPQVWAMVVVVVQPLRIIGCAGLFGVVSGCVRPLGCEGSVESFDLPIRLGPVGAGAAMLGFFQR
jgi:hypothetical protein